MEKSKIDLLPCPFCGRKPKSIVNIQMYAIGCSFSKCHVYPCVVKKTPEEAVKAWNTRAFGWIPCIERMPERDGFYLAYYTFADGRHACDIVYFNVGAPISSSITHWMPLPDPPEAEDKT